MAWYDICDESKNYEWLSSCGCALSWHQTLIGAISTWQHTVKCIQTKLISWYLQSHRVAAYVKNCQLLTILNIFRQVFNTFKMQKLPVKKNFEWSKTRIGTIKNSFIGFLVLINHNFFSFFCVNIMVRWLPKILLFFFSDI